MGFFDKVIDTAKGLPGRAVDVLESGLLGPGVSLATTLASGGSLSEALQGATGGAGMPGVLGLAEEVAAQQEAARNTGAARVGASSLVREANALNRTLGALLAANGIRGAPTGNVKATVVILLTPQGHGFIDSVERGTPAVMSRDLQTTKKTIRRIRKMESRIPKKIVKQSMAAQINDKVKQKIMQDIDCNNPLRITTGGGHCG